MSTFTDQTGHKIKLAGKPRRIISLVPSQSEFLWDIGLQRELVGITKFCIHPQEMFRSVERVGGTKRLNMDKIRGLAPDLIIANKEENEKSHIEELRKEFNVWTSDILDLSDAYDMMSAIGEITGKEKESEAVIKTIQERFMKLDAPQLRGKRVAYFIWYNPFIVAAGNTFIDHILSKLGCVNVFSYLQRYPEVSPVQIRQANADIILLSSEPFPFKMVHANELKQICPETEVLLVDGELFSWYGSRLQYAPAYFNSLGIR